MPSHVDWGEEKTSSQKERNRKLEACRWEKEGKSQSATSVLGPS